jgi:cell division protease FtsH
LNNIAKSIAIWLVVALVLMTVFNQFSGQSKTDLQIKYSDFMQSVKDGRIATAQIDGRVVRGKMQDGKDYSTYAPNDLWMVNDLLKNNVQLEAKPEQQRSVLLEIFMSWFPMILLIGVWIFFMRQMQGGGKGGGPFSFGKSKARQLDES